MRATLSPTAGVGASDRSTTPNGTPSRRAASCATSCPMRVMRKAVFLMVSATSSNGLPLAACKAWYTTPGPDTPTLMTHSASPVPWNAPAIKGLSSTALAKTVSLAQPMLSASAVAWAISLIRCPMSATASILMPARVVATLMLEQMCCVFASADGSESMSRRSEGVIPLCTSAENPPMKSTCSSPAARSSATARGV